MSLAGALADARKSATRMYINNFTDKGRQNTIDMLLVRVLDLLIFHSNNCSGSTYRSSAGTAV